MEQITEKKLIRLDIGCGGNKKGKDWIGMDQYQMEGVDVVCNIGKNKWPFEDNSVTEFHCAHVLEHLTNLDNKWERTHFFNELYRVLKPGKYENGKPTEGFGTLIFPHWASQRYYGDPTHKEPFSEFGFYYLSKLWRLGGKDANGNTVAPNAPHADIMWNKEGGYNCNFDFFVGHSIAGHLSSRNQEYVNFAIQNYKEAAADIIATLIKQ